MALRVLDGNQTATTLSSVVTGGEHIVAHSVVSLGANAIANIASAVSGSVVSISNFPASQTISGTVTANLPITEAWAGIYDSGNDCIKIELANLNGDTLSPSNPLPISGTVTASLAPQAKGPTSEIDSAVPSDPKYMINVGGIYPELSEYRSLRLGSSGEVVVSSVTIGSLPAISGTVTANVAGQYFDSTSGDTAQLVNPVYYDGEIYRVTPSFPLPVTIRPAPYGQTVVTISGTVTVSQLPRVTFIDGSGTVVTANSAVTLFASSSTRSYLLVQVTTGSAFVNVGATATTVNGINLTAGQGYAWETTIPQGLVSLISTTTSSRWVAKEA